jgi:peptidoglycan/LPS O-acetylase OafA/YrhL
MQFFWGVFLCDVQNHPSANEFMARRPIVCQMIAAICITLGLYIASYPEGHPEWMTWSKLQFDVLVQIIPENAEFPRFATAFGLELLTLGIHFSTSIKNVLSSKYLLWLGKQSFAVYLIHGPLLRWVLCWMVYGIHPPADVQDENGDWIPGKLIFPGNYRLLIWLPIWIPLNYGLAVLWTTYVDPWCAQVSEQMVTYVKRDTEEKQDLLLPH